MQREQSIEFSGEGFACRATLNHGHIYLKVIDIRGRRALMRTITEGQLLDNPDPFAQAPSLKSVLEAMRNNQGESSISEQGEIYLKQVAVDYERKVQRPLLVQLHPDDKVSESELIDLLFDGIKYELEAHSQVKEPDILPAETHNKKKHKPQNPSLPLPHVQLDPIYRQPVNHITPEEKLWAAPHGNNPHSKDFIVDWKTHEGYHVSMVRQKVNGRTFMCQHPIDRPSTYRIWFTNLNKKKWFCWGIGAASTLGVMNMFHKDYLNYDYASGQLRQNGVVTAHAGNQGGLKGLLQIRIDLNQELVQWFVGDTLIIQASIPAHMLKQPMFLKIHSCFAGDSYHIRRIPL